ncbi:phage tail sheath family protein [Spirosoma flavum]|uniref:Phage tail sheath family protein n=1 Tax=Spirosoma flavum TaxID=2048557 RepID=A0ABW6ALJ2_9BACT
METNIVSTNEVTFQYFGEELVITLQNEPVGKDKDGKDILLNSRQLQLLPSEESRVKADPNVSGKKSAADLILEKNKEEFNDVLTTNPAFRNALIIAAKKAAASNAEVKNALNNGTVAAVMPTVSGTTFKRLQDIKVSDLANNLDVAKALAKASIDLMKKNSFVKTALDVPAVTDKLADVKPNPPEFDNLETLQVESTITLAQAMATILLPLVQENATLLDDLKDNPELNGALAVATVGNQSGDNVTIDNLTTFQVESTITLAQAMATILLPLVQENATLLDDLKGNQELNGALANSILGVPSKINDIMEVGVSQATNELAKAIITFSATNIDLGRALDSDKDLAYVRGKTLKGETESKVVTSYNDAQSDLDAAISAAKKDYQEKVKSNQIDRISVSITKLALERVQTPIGQELVTDFEPIEATVIHNSLLASSKSYVAITKAIARYINTLPASAAMAGVYTSVDNNRGVWKAPANVSLNSVVAPTVSLSDGDQSGLNVDAVSGKSINAIRPFTGLGVLVWGARTLDGNSQDWRYINVRRTMIMIEQSVKLAARSYVFEPNDSGTWTLMNSMISSYLFTLWKRGALAGTKPDDAYQVSIGLGSTMTADDILNGIMNITILVAIVRPAEFIMLTFQQQMQKS